MPPGGTTAREGEMVRSHACCGAGRDGSEPAVLPSSCFTPEADKNEQPPNRRQETKMSAAQTNKACIPPPLTEKRHLWSATAFLWRMNWVEVACMQAWVCDGGDDGQKRAVGVIALQRVMLWQRGHQPFVFSGPYQPLLVGSYTTRHLGRS